MRQALPLRRAMTMIEIMVVIGVVVLILAIALPFLGGIRTHHHGTRHLRDSTQVRGITQAAAIWAQNNQDRYPTPSEVDLNGDVIERPQGLVGPDRRLDTTGNMMSMLIFNGFFPVELTISPAEAGNVDQMQNYQSANPGSAVNPTRAYWDPAFRGTALDEWGGRVPGRVGDASHNSYAQVAWFDDRTHLWSNTFNATEAMLGNRGPAYTLNNGAWEATQGSSFGSRSTTMMIHGPNDAWHGNIGFNDQHVEYHTRADPVTLTWTFPGLPDPTAQSLPDNMFHAEHDHSRAPIDEHIKLVMGSDGRGTMRGDGVPGGQGALDQRNNYLRPIARVLPGENGAIEAEFWID